MENPSPPRSKRARAREWADSWENFLRPSEDVSFFEESPLIGRPMASSIFDWWMAEICRFVYLPDAKEIRRFKLVDARPPYLDLIPLHEVANLHKTGTHIAIFRVTPENAEPWTLVAFRGTTRFRQWLLNLSASPIRIRFQDTELILHQGFQLLFNRIWPQLRPYLETHLDTGHLVFTGHSLGGVLAQLSALHFPPSAGVWTFGSPRVGNHSFRQALAENGTIVRRFVNHHDIVPLLPHSIERLAPFDYQHVGDFLYLTKDGTVIENPSLAEIGDLSWKPHLPLTYLAKSMRNGRPPECVLDHSMVRYCKKLRSLI